jgi:hypothetical protein
VVVEEKASA